MVADEDSNPNLNFTLPSSVDCSQTFSKQIGPKSKWRAWSESNLFDTQMVFLKEFFEKVDFEKNQQTTKKHEISQGAKSQRRLLRICEKY